MGYLVPLEDMALGFKNFWQSLFYVLCGGAPLMAIAAGLEDPRQSIHLLKVGHHELRVITPQLLELFLVTTKEPDLAPLARWEFIDSQQKLKLPPPSAFSVRQGAARLNVAELGYRRRPLYAPLRQRDLRLGVSLFLKLESPLREGEPVEVTSSLSNLFSGLRFAGSSPKLRYNPALHASQIGYAVNGPKQAMVGYFLGNLGELEWTGKEFEILRFPAGQKIFSGSLTSRVDRGFDFPSYQKVLAADFSALKEEGEFVLHLPGMGVSHPFVISDGVAAALARTYSLGLYHQRCGTNNTHPFTRFVHGPCHLAPAEVPTAQHKNVTEHLGKMAWDATNSTRHTAPTLRDISKSRYPFVRQGRVEASGGHHDAGDYSKYTINSAQLIHHLVFSVDSFPGVAELDNLGLPESGDGKSDLLQEAKWEADFLVKMQDSDGGFYFLVYPRDRQYEDNVLPDAGDPQVVFPKTTAATAASVAALAQCSSSPVLKKQFPQAAAIYRSAAERGWVFLEKAVKAHGWDGSYQKITHYGNEFTHDDEMAWAATELFLATGDSKYQKFLLEKFDPDNSGTRRWTWWRLYEAYGSAIRSYAFAARSGRQKPQALDLAFLKKCEKELIAAAEDQSRFAEESAYGTSFPDPSKRFRNAGWYFSSDRAFDLAVGAAMDHPAENSPRTRFIQALWSNFQYEAGCNPVNISYLTGVGWQRPREMVHHFSLNDERVLPPSGLPFGNIQGGFAWLDNYKKELGAVSFPFDWDKEKPYPFYDRWGDSFNTSTEFVVINQARALGAAAFLMASTAQKSTPWRPKETLVIEVTRPESARQMVQARFQLPAQFSPRDLVVWEIDGGEPVITRAGAPFNFTLGQSPKWIEAELVSVDGRRLVGRKNLESISP